jgi:hypothetical protein
VAIKTCTSHAIAKASTIAMNAKAPVSGDDRFDGRVRAGGGVAGR